MQDNNMPFCLAKFSLAASVKVKSDFFHDSETAVKMQSSLDHDDSKDCMLFVAVSQIFMSKHVVVCAVSMWIAMKRSSKRNEKDVLGFCSNFGNSRVLLCLLFVGKILLCQIVNFLSAVLKALFE